MKQEAIKLHTRPCPFCGGTDIILSHTWFETDGGYILHQSYAIKCNNDQCKGSSGIFENIEDAYNAWEKRASDKADEWLKRSEELYPLNEALKMLNEEDDIEERIHEYLRGKHDQY